MQPCPTPSTQHKMHTQDVRCYSSFARATKDRRAGQARGTSTSLRARNASSRSTGLVIVIDAAAAAFRPDPNATQRLAGNAHQSARAGRKTHPAPPHTSLLGNGMSHAHKAANDERTKQKLTRQPLHTPPLANGVSHAHKEANDERVVHVGMGRRGRSFGTKGKRRMEEGEGREGKEGEGRRKAALGRRRRRQRGNGAEQERVRRGRERKDGGGGYANKYGAAKGNVGGAVERKEEKRRGKEEGLVGAGVRGVVGVLGGVLGGDVVPEEVVEEGVEGCAESKRGGRKGDGREEGRTRDALKNRAPPELEHREPSRTIGREKKAGQAQRCAPYNRKRRSPRPHEEKNGQTARLGHKHAEHALYDGVGSDGSRRDNKERRRRDPPRAGSVTSNIARAHAHRASQANTRWAEETRHAPAPPNDEDRKRQDRQSSTNARWEEEARRGCRSAKKRRPQKTKRKKTVRPGLTLLPIAIIVSMRDRVLQPHGHIHGLAIVLRIGLCGLVRPQGLFELGAHLLGDALAGDRLRRRGRGQDAVEEESGAAGGAAWISPVHRQPMMSCSWVTERERMRLIMAAWPYRGTTVHTSSVLSSSTGESVSGAASRAPHR
ncbi:hypothetical protein B0H16DRAFT_1687396 [Mycena metata]|uniref:Uncharacterized protein n=1 Tax=Mycena metata TaxID=1033252 RepID=A0AAD7JHX7_9AGAR|nr:hypothetical protein B0H16DRAFT_1687396 [Mycena metata]